MGLDNIAVGTEAGRALVSRKLGKTLTTVKMDIASMLNRAVASKKDSLTGDEKSDLKDLAEAYNKLGKDIESQQETVNESQASSIIQARSKASKKKQTMQQATAKKKPISDFALAAKLEPLVKDKC